MSQAQLCIKYDPACVECRRDAGKDAAGTAWQCIGHAYLERDSLRTALATVQAERDAWKARAEALAESYCPYQATADAALQRAEQAEAALAQAQAERDEAQQQVAVWETVFRHSPSPVRPVAQPPALPPLPPDWHERCGDTWVGFYYLEYDEDTGSQIVATRLGVDVDTIGTVNVSDLITVLRHAERAHQQMQEGQRV